MKAFQSIRAEMREAAIAAIHPYAAQPAKPMQRERETAEDDEDEGNIEPWMAAAFREVLMARETDAPIALISCFMNGEPTAIIALTKQEGRRTHVMPLFVACTPSMSFSDHPPDPVADETDD